MPNNFHKMIECTVTLVYPHIVSWCFCCKPGNSASHSIQFSQAMVPDRMMSLTRSLIDYVEMMYSWHPGNPHQILLLVCITMVFPLVESWNVLVLSGPFLLFNRVPPRWQA